MKTLHSTWTHLAILGALAMGPSCVVDGDIDSLELDDDSVEGVAPSGIDALTTDHHVGAFPGFPVEIATDGSDIVLNWGSLGGGSVVVLRSTDANDLIDVDLDALPGSVTEITIDPATPNTLVDSGAASRQSATPHYFYRVAHEVQGNVEWSTMVMKITSEVHPGYNKFALCMLDGVQVASDIGAEFGSAAQSTHLWNETTQSWLSWASGDGQGPTGNFALPYGGVVAVYLDATTDPYLSLVGTVPTNEPFELSSQTGLNIQTFPVLYDGPALASYWVDAVGYWGMGEWDAQTQSSQWYWGPQNPDFALEACQPYYIQLPPDSCNSDNECNDGQYCEFDIATSCGDFGAGICKPVQLGCPDDDAPVCGCDGVTRANACEAAAAGVSVASDGACEPECMEVDWFADGDGDGFGDPADVISACDAPAGYTGDSTDCDDTNAAVNPGAMETEGNGIDDDCDPGTPDELACLPGGAVCDPFAANTCCAPNFCIIGPNRCLN